MNKSEIKKAKMCLETLSDFFTQFGNDIYSQILLEEIFKGIKDAEDLFVFGKQEQKGNQVGDSVEFKPPQPSECKDRESISVEPPDNLPEENRENCS